MFVSKYSSALYYRVSFLFFLLLSIQPAHATSPTTSWYARGSTGVISFDPVLPVKGRPFTIRVSGKWRNSCVPDQDRFTFWAEDRGPNNQIVDLHTFYSSRSECRDESKPTPYELTCTLPEWPWDALDDKQHWNVNFSVQPDAQYVGARPFWERQNSVVWKQKFDSTYGLHAIPPSLGTGYWVSDYRPYQGLTVSQQGDTVVAHDLKFNRVTGEPNWHYAMGRFSGNDLNGVARLINWLEPGTIDPEWIEDYLMPFQDKLLQPDKEDLSIERDSFGLEVHGVNRIVAFVGLIEKAGTANRHPYRRWVFNLSDIELPSVVPDMAGVWNLYGFDGQRLKQTHQIEFRTGTKVGADQYHFTSVGNEWGLDCEVNINGLGSCTLSNGGNGWTMTYNLVSEMYMQDGSIDPHFNGNYAYAPLLDSKGLEPDQTGILLRHGLHLPVLDLEYPDRPYGPGTPPVGDGLWNRPVCSGS